MDTLIEVLEPQDHQKPVVNGWRLVVGYAGFFMMLIGIVILVPLLFLPFYPQESKYWWNFVVPGVICFVIGAIPFFAFTYKRRHAQLQTHQDAFIVVLCWIIAILACAIPFASSDQMTFTQAFFESASGITTTGMTLVSDFENFPHVFFVMRSLTHLIGGIGLILVMISVLSDKYGMRLYSSEGHYDRFLPNLLKSSRAILLIYIGFIASGTVAYIICGMSPFDAINHSISAVATGGFSTHANSIGYYNSHSIEIVSVVLMLLGSTNFLAHVFLLKGKLKNFFCYCENKAMYLTYAILIPLAAIGFFYGMDKTISFSESFRIGGFQVVSALSTTGFQITSLEFGVTPSSLLLILTFCMLIGGQSNSTAGGFKLFRLNMLVKTFYMKVRDSLKKDTTIHYYRVGQLEGNVVVNDSMVKESLIYVCAYMFIYLVSVLVMTMFGYSVGSSFFEMSALIGTGGLSTGAIKPDAPAFLLYYGTLVMLFGRLETFVVFYGFIYAIRTPFVKISELWSRRKEK